MKNKIFFFISLTLIIGFYSCSDEVLNEIDTNPNLLNDAPLNSLLPQAIISYSHEIVGGSAAVYSGFMSELTTHVLGNNPYDNFDVFNTQPWENAYLLLNDLNYMKEKAANMDAWTYAGIADILKAFTLTTLVDLFGDVPYSQAFDPEIRAPEFDSHEDLYPIITGIVDDGIANLQKDKGNVFPTNDDLVFEGDQEMWLKTAYALKARLSNKLSNLNPTESAQDALAAIDNSFESANENFMLDIFNESFQNGNPLSVSQSNQPQTAVGNGVFNAMLNFTPNDVIEEDPRALIWFTTVDGERIAAPNGVAEADFGEPRMDGAIYSKPEILKFNSAPFPILNYVELLFIEAEAQLRLGNREEAYQAYQEAVRTALEQAALFNPSVALTEEQIETYLSYPKVNPGADNLTNEHIILQKFIYFFQGQPIEGYNESRRTDFIPATNPYGRGNRMLYANSELTRNPNSPSRINFFSLFEEETKLFWAH